MFRRLLNKAFGVFSEPDALKLRTRFAQSLNNAPKSRGLRLEQLEKRELLSLTNPVENFSAFSESESASIVVGSIDSGASVQFAAIPLAALDAETPEAVKAPSDVTLGYYDASIRKVDVSWTDNSDDETGFRVEYSTNGGKTWNFAQRLDADVVTRTATGVVPNAEYIFRVCALRGSEKSEWAYSDALQTIAYVNPPSDLTIGEYNLNARSLKLSWTDNSNAETAFYLERSTDGGKTWRFSATAPLNYTSLTAYDIQPNKTYLFRLCSLDKSEKIGWAYSSLFDPSQTTINAPSDLTVDKYDAETQNVTLNWIDNSDNETGFQIEYSNDGCETWVVSQVVDADVESATVGDIAPDSAYVFRVCAINADKSSDWAYSELLPTYAEPAAPGDLTPGKYDAENQSVTLNWVDNSDNETGFQIEYSTDGGETWVVSQVVDANVESATVENIVPGSEYVFRVCALNVTAASDWAYSEPFTPYAKLVAPSDLILGEYDAQAKTVPMTWQDNSDNETGFRVEYTTDGGKTWRLSENMEADSTERVAWRVYANSLYQFRVCAVRGAEQSEWAYSKVLDTTQPLVAPSYLNLGQYDPSSETLPMNWDDRTVGESGYRVEYTFDGGETWRLSERLGADVTERVAWDVHHNKTYQFRVCAVRGVEQSEWTYSEEIITQL